MPEITEIIRSLDGSDFWIITIIALGVSLASLYFGFRFLRRARLIEDMPTAKIRSAAQGAVELDGWGKAMPGLPIRSPLTGTPCLWWWYKVTRGSGKNRSTVASGTSDGVFFFEDETGRCIVNPDGAECIPDITQSWRGETEQPLGGPKTGTLFGTYNYTEKLLTPSGMLYALGWYVSRQGGTSPKSVKQETARLLRTWKTDQRWLRQEFDSNKDGKIDMREWEAARRKAADMAQAAAMEQTEAPDVDILMRPPDGRPFLLSSIPPRKLSRRFRLHSMLLMAAFFVAAFALIVLLISRFTAAV